MIIYENENFRVRQILNRDGRVTYSLERPYAGSGRLDEFMDGYQAEFVARYCSKHHAGSYASEYRKAAKQAWLNLHGIRENAERWALERMADLASEIATKEDEEWQAL